MRSDLLRIPHIDQAHVDLAEFERTLSDINRQNYSTAEAERQLYLKLSGDSARLARLIAKGYSAEEREEREGHHAG